MLETEGQIIIGIVTPLMRRAHQLIKHSGELVFIDSGGGMDLDNHRVFILLTHSGAGGVPLGVILTTNEKETTVSSGLQLLKSMLGEGVFFGRGESGPQVFMTDESAAERGGLKEAFPQSRILLCSFHVLQAYWRFLWDSKHGISKKDRPHLFMLLKNALYARTAEEFESMMIAALADPIAVNTSAGKYLCKLFARAEDWALCHRSNLLVRGNHTNNYVESAMRVMKDRVLCRKKALSLQHLCDFVTSNLVEFYERRLIDCTNCRLLGQKSIVGFRVDADFEISRIDKSFFRVQSFTNSNIYYVVDMESGFCSCEAAMTGAPCKHQTYVATKHNVGLWNVPPVCSLEMRALLFKVARGTEVEMSWLQPMRSQAQAAELTSAPLTSAPLASHDPVTMGPDVPEQSSVKDEDVNDVCDDGNIEI